MPRIFKNPFVTFAGTQLNSFVRDLALTFEVNEKEVTTAVHGTEISFPGLKKWRLTGKLLQSYAPAEVDELLFALLGDEVPRPVVVRPNNAPKAVGNPEYAGTGYLFKYDPVKGTVGEVQETEFDIGPASDLLRTTA